MQANNNPEWKDDADFWNDAWKDMQQRLDAESKPKRRPAFFWWWLGGVAALLVSGLLTANMLLPGDEVVNQEKTDVVLAEVAMKGTADAQVETLEIPTPPPPHGGGAIENAERFKSREDEASQPNLQRAAAQSNIAYRQSHIAYPETPSPTLPTGEGAIENAPRFESREDEASQPNLQRAAAQSNIAYRQSHIAYPETPSPTLPTGEGAIENAPRFESREDEASQPNLQRAAAQSNIAYRQSHIAYPETPSPTLPTGEGAIENAPRFESREDEASQPNLQRAAAQSNIANRISHIAYPETPSPTLPTGEGAIENAPRFESREDEASQPNLQRAAAQSNIAYRQSHIAYPPPPPADREDLLALSQIPTEEIVPLATALELPVVSPVKQKRKSHIDLLAGGTVSSAFEKPGYFAGLSYTLPTRGRVSFPISLRYRYDALEINEIDEQRLGQPTTVTDPQNDFNAAEAARQLVSDLAIGNFNELRTSGIELQVGIAWRVGSRLSLFTNGGMEYLLAARGPSLSSGDNSFADLSGTNRYVNLEIGNLGITNFDQAGVPTGTPTGTPGENFSAPVGVDRLAFRAGLGLDYRLTNRLTAFTGGQYLLSPIYREQAAGLRKGQFEVGMKWRMR